MGALADIGWLGAAFISYAIGRLILNYELYREDQGRDGFFNKILAALSFVFFFIGIVPTLIVFLVQSYPRKRIEQSARKEEREKCDKFYKRELELAQQGPSYVAYENFKEQCRKEYQKKLDDHFEQTMNDMFEDHDRQFAVEERLRQKLRRAEDLVEYWKQYAETGVDPLSEDTNAAEEEERI